MVDDSYFCRMKLFFRENGQGLPIILLHGIFGSSDNWLTTAKLFSANYHTYALDLRNHGKSAHHDDFSYKEMAADLLEFIETHQIKNPVLVGHSMGGKVAMNFALTYPDKLQKLVVVDIAPKTYNLKNYAILEGLMSIPVETITSRNEADELLSGKVPEAEVRQFLLKNLQRKAAGGFTWKLNLPAIAHNIEKVGYDLQVSGNFTKPTLFVRGSRSDYVRDQDMTRIGEIFPLAELQTLDTGHWVPAENPQEFVAVVTRWLTSQNS